MRSGNDSLDGGAGDADTASFSGTLDAYQITRTATHLFVAGKRRGGDSTGVDEIKNVGRFIFGDGESFVATGLSMSHNSKGSLSSPRATCVI